MDFPNPQEMAKNVFLQQRYPMLLYPDLAQQLQQMGIPMFLVEPKEIMNYKDAPPDIRRQMEQRAGLQPSQMAEYMAKTDVIAPDQVPQNQGGSGGQELPPSGAQQAIDQGAGGNPPPQQGAQTQQPLPTQQQAQSQPQQQVDQNGQSVVGSQQQQSGAPTEHTQVIVQGQDTPPFAGIDPSQALDHLKREFEFMASEQFLQLPHPQQVLYAKHVMAERAALTQGGGNQNVT